MKDKDGTQTYTSSITQLVMLDLTKDGEYTFDQLVLLTDLIGYDPGPSWIPFSSLFRKPTLRIMALLRSVW